MSSNSSNAGWWLALAGWVILIVVLIAGVAIATSGGMVIVHREEKTVTRTMPDRWRASPASLVYSDGELAEARLTDLEKGQAGYMNFWDICVDAGGIVYVSALADVRFDPVLYHEIAIRHTNYGYVIDGDTIPPMYDGKARQEKADCWWASIPAWISHPEDAALEGDDGR